MVDSTPYAALIGKRIHSFELNPDRTELSIFIETPDFSLWEKYKFIVEGECCSITWFESMDAPEVLIGGIVSSVEDIDMPDLGSKGTINHPYVDHVVYYGLKVTTDKGVCVIDYRNDSNGYYGGSVTLTQGELP